MSSQLTNKLFFNTDEQVIYLICVYVFN